MQAWIESSGRAQPALWIVVPAYNEATVIGATLLGLGAFLPHVVVVDDGSSDTTFDRAVGAGAHVVRHVVNLGQGAALQTGIDYALARGAAWICTFDADGQHDPISVAQMREAARRTGADVVLGTRSRTARSDVSPARRLLLAAALWYTRAQTRLPLTDTHNGLRLFSRDAAERLRLEQRGMAHASEILSVIARDRLRLVEVPTTVRYTTYSLAKGQRLSNAVRIAFDLLYARIIR